MIKNTIETRCLCAECADEYRYMGYAVKLLPDTDKQPCDICKRMGRTVTIWRRGDGNATQQNIRR